eukprot:CAMPEP_0174708846 /NCGR_PEP_ID=MMETSP1094-20130205/10988_1 /TAXON_ID=156173 /ORGANISM="Chrysochromulina brevifilum, Strain UTEX LB 985" /LENGTH=78 /DNA_ID=CAMNT_0015907459 /DNA_START=1 /DNA_END=237 /DNA_ORIENTATION=+
MSSSAQTDPPEDVQPTPEPQRPSRDQRPSREQQLNALLAEEVVRLEAELERVRKKEVATVSHTNGEASAILRASGFVG